MKRSMLRKAIATGSLAAAALFGASAHASTITNTDGTFAWTGFDWAQGGTAAVTGFAPTAGDTFQLDFMSWAVTLNNTPTTFTPTGMDINANGLAGGSYEYTVVARLYETVTGCGTLGSTTTITCNFELTSGTFSIYYDTTPDANMTANSGGLGFLDGIEIIRGEFSSQPGGSFTSNLTGTNGSGNSALLGTVSWTNTTYVNPELIGTVVGTELKIGNLVTNWVNPGGLNGVMFTADQLIMQADANQNFTAGVPEPGTLALFGIAMLAGGAVSRRKKAQK